MESHSEDLAFYEAVYVLSIIKHIQPNPQQPRYDQTNSVRKHLRLMDLIALMLVSGAKGDCAASSIIMPSAQIPKLRIYYSKNQPCSQNDHDFIIKVKGVLAGLGGINDSKKLQPVVLSLQEIIVMHCHRKIANRARKLQQAIGLLMPTLKYGLSNYGLSQPAQSILNAHFRKIGRDTSDTTLTQRFLTNYLERAAGGIISNVDDKYCTVLLDSWVIGKISIHDPDILPAQVVTCIRKLGDYYSAAHKLILSLYPYIKKYATELDIMEAVAPLPENITMSGSAQELLNRKSMYLHNLGTTGEQIQAAYPTVQGQSLNARASVTHCTHAEMNVLQMLLSISPQPKEIKIGVSKRCCFLCTEFFRIVEEEYGVKILFSGHHNKLYPGWSCFDDKLLPKIKQVVDEKLEIHLDKIQKFPRFDSEPLDSEEEEIEDIGDYGEQYQEQYQSRI